MEFLSSLAKLEDKTRRMMKKINRTEQTKEFVIYQRVFYGNKTRLRRISGDLVMPKLIQEVKKHIQNPSVYGVRVMNPLTYVQNGKRIFEPEKTTMDEYSTASRFQLDSIVLAHSFKVNDTRDKTVKEQSADVAMSTIFAEGILTGDISYVPVFRRTIGSEEDLNVLEKHLQKNRFIALYDFQNPDLEALFKQEEHWDKEKYKKPHCIIVNTNAITEYGFRK